MHMHGWVDVYVSSLNDRSPVTKHHRWKSIRDDALLHIEVTCQSLEFQYWCYVSLSVDKSEARVNGGIEIKGNEMYLAFRLEEL